MLSELAVLLQPMKEDPPPNAKCRDKFLVQSAVIPKERDTLLMSELVRLSRIMLPIALST